MGYHPVSLLVIYHLQASASSHWAASPFTDSGGGGLVTQSCPTLATPWTEACQVPLSMGFFRQEYWSGLLCPPSEDLPNPGLNPCLLCLLYWQAGSLPPESPGKPRTRLSLVQSLSRVRLFATLWTETHQAYLSITSSWSLPKFTGQFH